MLEELRVRDLGIIEDLTLLFEPGVTAITGETGTGKTLVLEALELLVGGRADAVLVAPGATEAWVEGRFVEGGPNGRESVLARAVPAGGGRSRAYLDGHLAPVSALAEAGSRLVDLHGQHSHQSLLSTAVQRGALDAFAQIDLSPLLAARARVRDIDAALARLGGDARARAREADLLRYQLGEIGAAALGDPDEDDHLRSEEDRLSEAGAHRDAAAAAHRAISGDGAAIDAVGSAIAALSGRSPLADMEARVRALSTELAEVASDLRAVAEELEDDPERLAAVRARRHSLRELRRKYGDTLADVLAFAEQAEAHLTELETHGARAAELEAERVRAETEAEAAAAAVAAARHDAAPRLAAAVQSHLHHLGMGRARLEIRVAGAPPADDVAFLFASEPGTPSLPLSKVASGGELARAMLAVRLVLTSGPDTLVFDEVDAGIGGEAALAVGRALAGLAPAHQVLVVTHLPQVAAFADHQVAVTKHLVGGRASARADRLDHAGRVVELSRMLSGQPASASARDHAAELLEAASRRRAGPPRRGGGVGAPPGEQPTAPGGVGAPPRRGGGVGAPPGEQT